MASQEASDRKVQRAALLIAVISGFLIPFVSSSVNISLPTIGREFHSDTILLGWIRTAYLLTAAVFLLPFGRIADMYGRKKVMRIGISIYTAASLLCAISSSTHMLIAARCLQGFGSSMVFGTAVAILISVFPPGDRGRALGIRVAFVYLGVSTGPSLGGFMTQQFGWRSIFLVNMALGLVIVALLTWRLKGEWAGARGEKFDVAGAVICSVSVFATIYGILHLADSKGAWYLAAGLLGIAAFAWFQSKSKNPILDVRLFSANRVFALSAVSALIVYCSIAAKGFLLSFYLQEIKGLSPLWAGLVLLAQPAVQAAVSPFAGRLSDKKVQPRFIASAGMAAAALALLLLAFIDGATSLGYVICSLALLGFGLALFASPNTNAIMGSVNKRSYSIASATHSTMIIIGMNLSMGIAMLLLSIHTGKVQLSPEHYASFLVATRTAFAIFATLCATGVFVSLARGKLRT